MSFAIPARIQAWRAAPHISARSVLVTILGDAVLPVAQSVWLSQLLRLAEPFGFSARLVRTSLFRLAEEGWVSSERHGRRSRYALTPLAQREFADAADRIYRDLRPKLRGNWTLVLFDGTRLSARDRDRLARHLGWHGFVAFGRGVLASPICSPEAARHVLDEAFGEIQAAVARAEFSDITGLVRDGFFSSIFAFDGTEQAYRNFVDGYSELLGKCGALSPVDAYCVRTMLIHDLRRITLRTPPVPRELLPTPWSGDAAFTLAGALYRSLGAASAAHLGNVLEGDYPSQLAERFRVEQVAAIPPSACSRPGKVGWPLLLEG